MGYYCKLPVLRFYMLIFGDIAIKCILTLVFGSFELEICLHTQAFI